MSYLVDLARQVYRKWTVDKDASTPKHEPLKDEIVALFVHISQRFDTLTAITLLDTFQPFASEALMNADLAHDAGVYAVILSNDADNGKIFKKLLASGAGSWEFVCEIFGNEDAPQGFTLLNLDFDIEGYEVVILTADGRRFIGETAVPEWRVGPGAGVGGSITGGFGGSALASNADVDATSSISQYPGDRLRSVLWLAEPRLNTDGTYTAKVSWDRKLPPSEDVTIDANGIVITVAMAAKLTLRLPSGGQSLWQGGASGAVITSTVFDAAIRMIKSLSATEHPYLTYNGITGLTGLRHQALFGSAGETHLGGFCRLAKDLLIANGAQLDMVAETMALGGHSASALMDHPGHLPRGYYGGAFEDLMRGINAIGAFLAGEGRTVVDGPLDFGHGEEDSGLPGRTAKSYHAEMRRYMLKYNEAMKRVNGWHEAAPPLPMMAYQCAVTPAIALDGSTKLFRGMGPMLQQWAAHLQEPDLFLPPIPTFDLATTDTTHLTARAEFIVGERDARRWHGYMFGKYASPFDPVAVTRINATTLRIAFRYPAPGTTLVFDTTAVADALNGLKNFVMWDWVTAAELTISTVTIFDAVTIEITHPASGSGGWSAAVKPVIDMGLWKDAGYTGNRSPTQGPRGNLRTNATYTSLITEFGEAAHTDYDWCPAFRVPAPPINSNSIFIVDGRFEWSE